jgi:hypothetical protein
VGTPEPLNISRVSLIRLASVTHALDQNQHGARLNFQAGAGKLTVTAPSSANVCPPGHYMLFILNTAGVPSIAEIVQVRPEVAAAPGGDAARARPLRARSLPLAAPPTEPGVRVPGSGRYDDVAKSAEGTPVVVGITGTCPYGIAACWGGAYEALGRLESVALVAPIPNAADSTATVFLLDDRLPPLTQWDDQFRNIVNGTYLLRGVEVTLQGVIEVRGGQLFLASSGQRPPVQLATMAGEDNIRWDRPSGTPKPQVEGEVRAYERLAASPEAISGGRPVMVTGPLKQLPGGFRLHVRLFSIRTN